MAKASTLDRKGVSNWFADLSFEAQKAVLADINASFERAKQDKIQELEQQLAMLKNGSATTYKAAPPKANQKRALKVRANPAKGVKIPPKYIDKKTGNTWAGRGEQPTWLREYLAKGGKLDALLVSKAKKN